MKEKRRKKEDKKKLKCEKGIMKERMKETQRNKGKKKEGNK
jgi:hypothetical protein